MRRAAVSLILVVLAFGGGGTLWAKKKSTTPITAGVKELELSPQEFRIRLRALIRPTLGTVEESADRIIHETQDPTIRRGIVMLKIEATTTLLSAMLRNDPVLALADAWGYAIQVEAFLARPEAAVRKWAEKNPIEGTLYRRPAMDTAVAHVMASSSGGGALAVLGSLDEATSDVVARLDLYTMYLPRFLHR